MRSQQSASSLGPNVPGEVIDVLDNFAPRNPVVCANSEVMNEGEQARSARVGKLKAQVENLYEKVNKCNNHFWPAVLNPDENLDMWPAMYSPGSVEEAQMCLQHTWFAMKEAPGTVDFIKAKIQEDIQLTCVQLKALGVR